MLPSPQPGINTVSSYTPLSYVSLLLTPSLSSPLTPHTYTFPLLPFTPHSPCMQQLAEMFEENMQKALETVARLEEEARKKRAGKNEPPQNGTLHKSSLEGTPEPEPAAEEEEEKEEEEEEEGNRMETTEEVEVDNVLKCVFLFH